MNNSKPDIYCTIVRLGGVNPLEPLRRAIDRGSEGLELLNSPLVLDYVSVKFSCTLPSWTSRNPVQPTVNEGEPLTKFCASYTRAKIRGTRPPALTLVRTAPTCFSITLGLLLDAEHDDFSCATYKECTRFWCCDEIVQAF